MFITQLWATLFGSIINYVVMTLIVSTQRETLLDEQGDHVWTGIAMQNVNTQAVSWSLSRQLFGVQSQYVWIPLGIILGTIPTTIQWLIYRVSYPLLFTPVIRTLRSYRF